MIFELLVWVDEGNYQVYFWNIVENVFVGYEYQQDVNLDLVNYVVVDQVFVQVIGWLYDFYIIDIVDYNWECVFWMYVGSKDFLGNSYWVGLNGIDGDLRGNMD